MCLVNDFHILQYWPIFKLMVYLGKSFFWLLVFTLLSVGCDEPIQSTSKPRDDLDPEWLLPEHRIFDGGPGRDGVPSIDNPTFVNIAVAEPFNRASDLVVILRLAKETKIYPYTILDWHEIVNDVIANEYVALTYCPLTGTAMAWDRHLALGITTFGVSGLLYNTNLIPYERDTGSEWSQMLMKGVRGWYKGKPAKSFKIMETNWSTAKILFPNARVLNVETGFDRPYGEYPYGDYREASSRLLFPIVPVDERLHLKERVHGVVINEQAKVYRFNLFSNGTRILADQFQDKSIVIIGNEALNFIVSFESSLSNGELLEFSTSDQSPTLFNDQLGNTWNLFGEAISGPNQGASLTSPNSLMGYWMSFSSFYPNPIIVTE